MRLHHYKWWQFAALVVPLFAVELTCYWKLASWLSWGYERFLAGAAGLAFLFLLLGSIVAHSLDMDESMLVWIHRAAVALFVSQGFANVMLVYSYEMTGAMPVTVMTSFFSFGSFELSGDAALRLNAAWQGMLLSLVSLSFWNIIAKMLHKEWQAELEAKDVLKEVQQTLRARRGEANQQNGAEHHAQVPV